MRSAKPSYFTSMPLNWKKQIIILTKENRLKNPKGQEADQLAI